MGLPVVLAVNIHIAILLLNEWAQWIPRHVEVLSISNCPFKELQSRSTPGWHTPVCKPFLVQMNIEFFLRRPVHAVMSIHCAMTLNAVRQLVMATNCILGHLLKPFTKYSSAIRIVFEHCMQQPRHVTFPLSSFENPVCTCLTDYKSYKHMAL
jgi:hypothetical protein